MLGYGGLYTCLWNFSPFLFLFFSFFLFVAFSLSLDAPSVVTRGWNHTSHGNGPQAMCDSLDHVAEERFPITLAFLQALVRTSEGRLGPLALQRTFR